MCAFIYLFALFKKTVWVVDMARF